MLFLFLFLFFFPLLQLYFFFSPPPPPLFFSFLSVRGDAAAVEEKLKNLSNAECLELARSFACFGQLTNVVEDLERADSLSSNHESDVLLEAVKNISDKEDFFKDFFVSPVLTAHPTQVMRTTQIRHQRALTAVLQQLVLRPNDADLLRELRALVVLMYETSLLRKVKLGVLDEVDNALSFFSSTFLSQVPRVVNKLEDVLEMSLSGRQVLQIGSWVGGDRDGNPFVTAEVLRETVARNSRLAMNHFAEAVHSLGSDLSQSIGEAKFSPELMEMSK